MAHGAHARLNDTARLRDAVPAAGTGIVPVPAHAAYLLPLDVDAPVPAGMLLGAVLLPL